MNPDLALSITGVALFVLAAWFFTRPNPPQAQELYVRSQKEKKQQ